MKCRRKHHTSICDETTAGGGTLEGDNQQHSAIKEQPSPNQTTTTKSKSDKPSSTHMGATNVEHYANSILLQTAAVKVSKDGIQHYQARILFDTGSQRTFITEQLKNKLKLEPI